MKSENCVQIRSDRCGLDRHGLRKGTARGLALHTSCAGKKFQFFALHVPVQREQTTVLTASRVTVIKQTRPTVIHVCTYEREGGRGSSAADGTQCHTSRNKSMTRRRSQSFSPPCINPTRLAPASVTAARHVVMRVAALFVASSSSLSLSLPCGLPSDTTMPSRSLTTSFASPSPWPLQSPGSHMNPTRPVWYAFRRC